MDLIDFNYIVDYSTKIDKGEQDKMMQLAEIQRLKHYLHLKDLEINNSKAIIDEWKDKEQEWMNKKHLYKNKTLNLNEKIKINEQEIDNLKSIISQQNHKIIFLMNEVDIGRQKTGTIISEPSDELSDKKSENDSEESNSSDENKEEILNINNSDKIDHANSPMQKSERINDLESENIRLNEKIKVITISFRELYQQIRSKEEYIIELEKRKEMDISKERFVDISFCEKLEEKYTDILYQYKQEIFNLEKDINHLKKENYNLTHRSSNSDSENMIMLLKELEDLKKEYFFTLCCGIKLNFLILGNNEAIANFDSRKLYKKAKYMHHGDFNQFISSNIDE